jgi:hypothetical protein
MRKALLFVGIALLFILAGSTSAQFDQFAGSWINTDSSTGGITRLEISGTGTDVRVHAWGSCTPQDCDWGEVAAYAYGPNVSADLNASAEAISAVYDTGFSQTILIIHPVAGDLLEVDALTRFTDQSGRSSYTSTDTFMRDVSSTLQRFLLHFSDAYLVYEPSSRILQITAQNNVLSYGSDWEVVQMQPFLYHMRQAVWQGFYWKVNTSRREVYRVTNGVFGQLGGNEEILNIQVEPVDNAENPTRFFLRFVDAYLVYQPSTGTLQITAQSNVLSYGSDWQVVQLQPGIFQLRQQVWQQFFWQIDTTTQQAVRVRNGVFGQPGGNQEPLNMQVEAVY